MGKGKRKRKRKRKRKAVAVEVEVEVATTYSNQNDDIVPATDSGKIKIKQAECPSQLPSVVRRAKRRKSKKEIDQDSSESEQTSPNSFRSCSQPKRRSNQQREKLSSHTFELLFEKLWKSFPEEKRNSFAYLDCLWYCRYTNDSCKQQVLSWIKKKNIFYRKYVFVPIIQWAHWSLLILCNFGEAVQSKTTSPCMLLLDSMQMAGPKRLEPGIRKFVLDIYKSEGRSEDKKLISKIPLLIPKVPQQRNGEECGNFVLYYMNLFMETAPENFSSSEGYPYSMKKDWFTGDDLERFCERLDSYLG